MRAISFIITLGLLASMALAHSTYTGYSGAPGSSGTCATSCHANPGGTITVTGFPSTYTPGQAYTVTVGGGNITNFNSSIRIGSTSSNAGTISSGSGTVTYNVSGETNGVHFSVINQTSGTFTWMAPAAGAGAVRLYLGGVQNGYSGQNSIVMLTSNEAAASLPGVASNPSPTNNATGVALNASLSWTAGSGATSHDVRFGTTNPPPAIGNQTGTSYNPGALAGSTVYYWRIDERNAAGVTNGSVWQFTTQAAPPPLPGAASNPSPANNATGVALNASLTWTAGSNTTSHDVYFGTSNPPASRGNQTGTSYAPGALVGNTVYYWRIDERNATGVTTGTVWQFTTQTAPPPLPGAASAPSPANNATGVALNASLSWTAGSNATSHDVFFGTSNPPASRGNQTGTSYAPGALTAGTVYYWRIDERNATGVTTGTVWQFTTQAVVQLPGAATNPSPADSASGVALNAALSWTAGSGATSHDVFFGTSNPPASRGNQTGTSYAPGALAASTVYFWRIDERNSAGVTTGTVWRFTTQASTPGGASNPNPANGATGVSRNVTVSWSGHAGANYSVYLGRSADELQRVASHQSATSYHTHNLRSSRTYYWRVDEYSSAGRVTGQVWHFRTQSGGDDGGDDGHDDAFDGGHDEAPALGQAYPNPFNATVSIPFELQQATTIRLAIYDITGRELAVLANGSFAAGSHSVQWSCANAGTGVYYLRLSANGHTVTSRITAIK